MPRIDASYIRAKGISRPITISRPLTPAAPVHASKIPSVSPSPQLTLRKGSPLMSFADDVTLTDGISLKEESLDIRVLSEHLINKAKVENNVQRKGRLLMFAKVCESPITSGEIC